ncbi:uncharacterized protein M421DRAFT_5499 [Didymella exigua CBS 183.55]|uniref:Uncharacterized protein n=1 Tax=Didymella exigua CBS 183.55 TaxID=1150837 RepID=A0A6A5RMV7_9PLEO|nr:uncharacterized protein M421DRAFT_5499 [Didymella exigua CBS 183.55]KAF1928468.1 hypothetical protein M421DRAFT_5499 [Didymella exigua CBS 183.55]
MAPKTPSKPHQGKPPYKTFSTLVKYKVASCVSKKLLHLLKYSAPVRPALEKRINLPKHTEPEV